MGYFNQIMCLKFFWSSTIYKFLLGIHTFCFFYNVKKFVNFILIDFSEAVSVSDVFVPTAGDLLKFYRTTATWVAVEEDNEMLCAW